MSKIFESENQFILRLPENIADRVHQVLNSNERPKTMDLQPYIEKIEENGQIIESLNFKSNRYE